MFLSKVVRFCLSLRYKVHVEGEELLKKYRDASILIVATHPALIDPAVVISFLEPYLLLQPLAAERFFKSPLIHFFLKKIKALPVPEFDQGNNEYKAYKVKKLTQKIKEALNNHAKILLYPSGHLTDSCLEKIGGASLAFELKTSSKKMIGLATDGLYGSSFSRYFEGQSPSFFKMLARGFKVVVANGLFFVPKREVSLRLFEIDPQIRQLDDKVAFNKALEQAFNERLSCQTAVVGYGFYPSPKKVERIQSKEAHLEPKLALELTEMAEKVLNKKVTLKQHLSYELGMDSLQLAELLTRVDQKYHVRIDTFPQTLLELGVLIADQAEKIAPNIQKASLRLRLPIEVPECKNLLEGFYKQALRAPTRRLGQDPTLGEISYKKGVLIVELLATKLAKLKGPYIAILLPSSLMSYLLMFALLRAKKIPVMLNWTAGYTCVDFAFNLLGISAAVSSETFLERAFNVDLREHFDKVIPIEQLKQTLSFGQKLKVMLSCFSLKTLTDKAALFMNKEQEAVILFTSGSESMPKAVPLSHANILANLKSLVHTHLVKDDDVFLATLPPFHSFGAVVSGFFPMVAGVDTVYMPDPTDAISLAQAIKKSSSSLFCSAPSFLKQILLYAAPGQLHSLRLVVVGAEKLQDSLKQLFSECCPQAVLLEGYGITECSPVVTLQKSVLTQGVGVPLKGVELLIVDPVSLCPLPQGSVGEILISGQNVFKGYLGIKKDPFVEIDCKKWYRSGDRGSLSAQHELILEGRFKRFIKISAEMISLGAIEEALEDYRQAPQGLAQFAVVADKTSEKMILLTTHTDLDLDELNHYLREKGCPKVAKISKIIVSKLIPQLATGKIDYRKLEHELI
jgi:long-chain-fatty-acid--[acyl-carrier-protein] ligase